MSNHGNRGRIRCTPITRKSGLMMGITAAHEPLAYTYEFFPQVPDGVLVRIRSTGILVKWIGGCFQSIDQRKASAALSWMHKEAMDANSVNKPTSP